MINWLRILYFKWFCGCEIGKGVRIAKGCNLYGCIIRNGTKIGFATEIQKGAEIGEKCKISSHSFIPEGVVIDSGVFIGHGVIFCTDKYPKSLNKDGELKIAGQYELSRIWVRHNVSIGSGATIVGPIVINWGAVVGAGSIVNKNIPNYEVWVGNPAKFLKKTS